MKLNLSKCQFAKHKVKFLGHVISEAGCQPDPDNIKAIRERENPKKVKEVRSFLGMAGFYRRFIPNFAKIALPLTELTKKDTDFEWTDECTEARQTLKHLLTSAPIIVRAHPTAPLVLTTDASDSHVGGVLMQKLDDVERTIGYFSKKLSATEQRYSATDKEGLAVVLACRHFEHHLWARKFTIMTDHQPLTYIFKRKTKSPRMNRWILEMRGLNYSIMYIKGKNNHVADALSRPPVATILSTREPQQSFLGLTKQEFIERQIQDPKLNQLRAFLEQGTIPTLNYHHTIDQFEVLDNILYFIRNNQGTEQYCLFIPESLTQCAAKTAHIGGGHVGQKKTITAAMQTYYWPKLRKDCLTAVKTCTVCQQYKEAKPLNFEIQEFPEVHEPLERVSLDLTDMVNGHGGYNYALTITDHYSRYVVFYKLKTKAAKEVVEGFQQYIDAYGPPKLALADNGKEMIAESFKTLCDKYQIKSVNVTPYHAAANGVTERMHKSMKAVLLTLCLEYPTRWPLLLSKCQRMMNTVIHASTGCTPYFAFFRRHPPRGEGVRLPEIPGTEEDLAEAHELLMKVNRQMGKASRDNKNKNRTKASVEEGELVWVKRELFNMDQCRKLQRKWNGPYKVVEKTRGGSTYLLRHLENGQVIRRAADKIKRCILEGEWLIGKQDDLVVPTDILPEKLPPRTRRAPRRLIEND